MEDWQAGGFGLYVHWPYCVSKCPYCDFNSHVSERVDHAAWADAFEREIRRLGAETPDRVLNTVYFGGGTPSLMAPETVDRILRTAEATWRFSNQIEITLEANPSSVEAATFSDYRQAGVNRVSLGVQALNDPDLRRLGRAHSADEALKALDIARSTFDRVSFDLIYARQNQTRQDWQRELQRALSFRPDHLSLYQLTIEDGTVFGRRFAAGQLRGLPSEDQAVDMYLDTQNLCESAGLRAYEVSNHARPGQESRHNLIYWQGGDYLGIGPGAHGRLTRNGQRQATQTPLTPKLWLAQVQEQGHGELPRETLTPQDRAEEYLLMGLRLTDGIDLNRWKALAATTVDPGRIADLIDLGLLVQNGPQLRTTQQGRLVLNQVLAKLIA